MDYKALVDTVSPFIVPLVKKTVPDTDEKTVGAVLQALGVLLTDLGNGLNPPV